MKPRFINRAGIVTAFVLVAATGCSTINQQQIVDGRFDLDASGYVRNWLIVKPQVRPHFRESTPSGDIPDKQVEKWVPVKPDHVELGGASPIGKSWKYYYSGENIFMEMTSGKPTVPSAARMYAAVDLEAPQDMEIEARAWLSGWTHVWINDTHLGQQHKSPVDLKFPLRKGRNRFIAYTQNGGVRGVFHRVGLRMPDQI
ncbi:MAG: hypothetical protein JSV03_07820, partial [Planctomycetota bacterium]